MVNSTHLPRVVLLIRFWHPQLVGAAPRRQALEQVLAERADAYRDRWVPPLPFSMRAVEEVLPLYTTGRDAGVVCRGCGPQVLVELGFQPGNADKRLSLNCTRGGRVVNT